jgi:ComF family protein
MAPAMVRLRPAAPNGVLVPVPLGAARQRERGYNQSEMLALALGKMWHREVSTTRVRRTRETARQTDLAPAAREVNVSGAFRARWPGRTPAVLVDDVFTTGSTLSAVARALLDAGAPAVSAVTFARARRPLDDAVEALGRAER